MGFLVRIRGGNESATHNPRETNTSDDERVRRQPMTEKSESFFVASFALFLLLIVSFLLFHVLFSRSRIAIGHFCVQELRRLSVAREAIARIGVIIAVYYVLVILRFFSPHFMPDIHIHPVPLLIYVVTVPATFGLLSSCRWLRIIAIIIMALSFSLFAFACIVRSLYLGYLNNVVYNNYCRICLANGEHANGQASNGNFAKRDSQCLRPLLNWCSKWRSMGLVISFFGALPSVAGSFLVSAMILRPSSVLSSGSRLGLAFGLYSSAKVPMAQIINTMLGHYPKSNESLSPDKPAYLGCAIV